MRFSGKRILKNTGSQVDKKIDDFRATLLELRKAFLDEATITAEITALQILDDVGIISANVGRISSQLDGVATQLKWVSSQVSDAGTWSRYLEGYRSEDCHRARRKNQRNSIRDGLPIHTRQGLSYGNTHGLPGLHRQMGK